MEVILIQDLHGLGYKNDTITVKPGYGRNFLIPRGIAIIANNSNKKKIEENIRQASHKAEKIKNDALEVAEKMGDLSIQIGTKAGETGKIFGAITPIQVADALQSKGFEIDRKKIIFESQIKEVGTYKVTLDLHKEVKHVISVIVVAE